jgi:hypothetical protein
LNLILPARAERALRHFFQHVVAANGFDDFFLGFLAVIVVIIIGFIANRRRDQLGMIRCNGLSAGMFGVLTAAVFGVRRVVGMGQVFVSVLFVGTLVIAVLVVGIRR